MATGDHCVCVGITRRLSCELRRARRGSSGASGSQKISAGKRARESCQPLAHYCGFADVAKPYLPRPRPRLPGVSGPSRQQQQQ